MTPNCVDMGATEELDESTGRNSGGCESNDRIGLKSGLRTKRVNGSESEARRPFGNVDESNRPRAPRRKGRER